MKRLIITITIIAGMFWRGEGRADIYRFNGEDEIVYFSDSPNDKRYQLVMKEQQSRSVKRGKGNYLPAPKALAIALPQPVEQNGSNVRILPLQGIITSPLGLRSDPFDGRLKHHNGLDIAAPSGTPVKPVARGTVIFSGWKGGYGNTVILDHNDGMVTVYAHHASNNVSAGETVDTDTVIALSGSTGRSTGPHLHFEAWQGGVNITRDFMPGNRSDGHSATLASAPIRHLLQEDGTILFTNLR